MDTIFAHLTSAIALLGVLLALTVLVARGAHGLGKTIAANAKSQRAAELALRLEALGGDLDVAHEGLGFALRFALELASTEDLLAAAEAAGHSPECQALLARVLGQKTPPPAPPASAPEGEKTP